MSATAEAPVRVGAENGRRMFDEDQAVPRTKKVSEALAAAGLDFTVRQEAIYRDSSTDPIEGYVGNFADIKGETRCLGIVTPRYQPIQNAEAFDLCDLITEETGAEFVAGGLIRGGKRVWAFMEMPEPVVVAGDEVLPYLLFLNNHDGGGSVQVALTPMRVKCTNALTYALRKAPQRFYIRHVGDVHDKLEEARKVIEINREYFTGFAAMAGQLAQRKLNDKLLSSWLGKLYPTDGLGDKAIESREEAKATVRYLVREAPNLEGHHNTAWGFVNAVAELADWGSPRERDRMRRLAGTNKDYRLKNRALEIAAASLN